MLKLTIISLLYVLEFIISSLTFLLNDMVSGLKAFCLFVVLNLGATNAYNEAMQNTEQTHSQWAVPGTNVGSPKWRYPCNQSCEQRTRQYYHPLVKIMHAHCSYIVDRHT